MLFLALEFYRVFLYAGSTARNGERRASGKPSNLLLRARATGPPLRFDLAVQRGVS